MRSKWCRGRSTCIDCPYRERETKKSAHCWNEDVHVHDEKLPSCICRAATTVGGEGNRAPSYLQDHRADEPDALDYWLLIPRYRHPSLGGVGQQIPRHLYLSSGALPMIGEIWGAGGGGKRKRLVPEMGESLLLFSSTCLPDLFYFFTTCTDVLWCV